MSHESEIDVEIARTRLTAKVLSATTLPDVLAATQALRDWIKAHPEDAGMADAFEQLANMQEIAEMEEAERAGPHQEPTPAEQAA